MVVSRSSVRNAVMGNQTDEVCEILEAFGFSKDGSFLPYSTGAKELVVTILNAASAKAHLEQLDGELAQEIVARTARTVELFTFVEQVLDITGIDTRYFNTDAIPDETIASLTEDDISIAGQIGDLDYRAFGSSLTFIMTDEVEELSEEFGPPIIRRVFADRMLPDELLFAYMASYQREIRPSGLARILGLTF